ncbi:hypothetical protein DFH07DRAFT_458930 [Mycena maculata]|uniref:Uncharacterized protein n=1 Tax=Mycena maculata TaxID=230809 RepID=A0AAD7J7G8_9AGAR|nr:hypothetical protein DFH07DRAFT_458930 [Mycena maculata]
MSSTNTTDEVYSESEIYYRQLLRQKRGVPLHHPGPQQNLPEKYQRHGVAIGDVGRISPDGIFDFFFNIYLPADHPINENDVPEDFAPLQHYIRKDIFHLDFEAGTYVSSPSAQMLNLEAPSDEFPGGEFMFICDAPHGALLALPHGAHLEKLENLENMRQYVAKNAESWYRYINDVRGRGLVNGVLYLVTGWEKSPSWGMASFHSVREEFQLMFKPTMGADSAYNYRWKGIPGRKNPAHMKSFKHSETDTPLNQTTFVHGFSISLGGGIWARLFGDVGICQNVDFPFDSSGDPAFRSHSVGSSLFSWSLNFFSGGGATGSQQRAAREGDVFISDSSLTSKSFHPSGLINHFLLHKAPHATVVMSHDDDWRDILYDDGTDSIVEHPRELLQQINDQFDVVDKNGAIFFVSKSRIDEPDNTPYGCGS